MVRLLRFSWEPPQALATILLGEPAQQIALARVLDLDDVGAELAQEGGRREAAMKVAASITRRPLSAGANGAVRSFIVGDAHRARTPGGDAHQDLVHAGSPGTGEEDREPSRGRRQRGRTFEMVDDLVVVDHVAEARVDVPEECDEVEQSTDYLQPLPGPRLSDCLSHPGTSRRRSDWSQPVTMSVSTPSVWRSSCRSVPLKADAYFLTMSFSVGRRSRALSSVSAEPSVRRPRDGHLPVVGREGLSLLKPMVVKKMGNSACRATRSNLTVSSTTDSPLPRGDLLLLISPRSMTNRAGRSPKRLRRGPVPQSLDGHPRGWR